MTEGKRHLFLTGAVQTGKSTIIRRFLEFSAIPPGELGGFQSAVRIEAGGTSTVHLVSPAKTDEPDRENCIMRRRLGDREKRGFPEVYPEIFEKRGVELLGATEGKRLILMDELGFAEQDAPHFQRAVFENLEGEIPVLGVLKKWSGEFLRKVAAHPGVQVVEITEKNRDAVAALMNYVWNIGSRKI